MRRARLIVVVLVAGLITGCGGGSSIGPSQSSPQAALKSYDLAWAEGDAKEACELLADQGRRAVETEMSNRTIGGLPLICTARMKEILELLGPESNQELEELADEVSSRKTREKHGEAVIEVGQEDLMVLRETDGSWYIAGTTIREIEPFLLTQGEIEESETEEAEEEGQERAEAGTVDAQEVKEQLPDSLGVQVHEALTESICPEEVPAIEGEIFTCDETTESGKRYQAELEVIGEEGAFVILRQFPSKEY